MHRKRLMVSFSGGSTETGSIIVSAFMKLAIILFARFSSSTENSFASPCMKVADVSRFVAVLAEPAVKDKRRKGFVRRYLTAESKFTGRMRVF